MYKTTNTKKEEIQRLYDEGVMLTEICKLTSSSQPTVKKVLLSCGIDYDAERKKAREKQLQEVIELYNQGKSQLYIETTLKLTRKTIRELLKEAGVEYRDKSQQQHINNNTEINHHAFDELTPEVLYWIGMLFTDGHIEQKKEASIDLTLHNNDIDHLYKFKEFLGSSRDIKQSNGDCSRLRVNSKPLRDRLVELGFTHNKSTSIVPHELLKDSRDFWRGCIDGDGGIYMNKVKKETKTYFTPHVFLCGTLETIFEFAIFCNKYAGVKDKYPTKAPGNNFYRISYYGKDARKIATYLYKDSTVYLQRKYDTYRDFLNFSEEELV
jgi:hypothetical protein